MLIGVAAFHDFEVQAATGDQVANCARPSSGKRARYWTCGRHFPTTWFALKKRLEELPGDCISYDGYQKLCAANGEKDAGNQEVLIGFLNDLGSVLHFREDARLNNLGVLAGLGDARHLRPAQR